MGPKQDTLSSDPGYKEEEPDLSEWLQDHQRRTAI